MSEVSQRLREMAGKSGATSLIMHGPLRASFSTEHAVGHDALGSILNYVRARE